jgi:hypothetical protein
MRKRQLHILVCKTIKGRFYNPFAGITIVTKDFSADYKNELNLILKMNSNRTYFNAACCRIREKKLELASEVLEKPAGTRLLQEV